MSGLLLQSGGDNISHLLKEIIFAVSAADCFCSRDEKNEDTQNLKNPYKY